MKINMWMIADMLRGEEIEQDIHSDMRYDIFGVSLTPDKGCVCLTQQGSDVLCSYEKDRIVCKNRTVIYVLSKMQRIFNFYNDWKDRIITLCRAGSWQRVVDSMEPVFSKPIVLFDLNQRVVAMSGKFKRGSVNEEWDYLLDYGYASNAAFQYARTSSRFFEILHTGSGVFYYASTPNQPTESLTVCIKSNDIPWGYITSVGVEDKYRHGEIDALFCLSKIIEANIPIKNETINDDFSKNVFKEYLTNPEADNLENLRRLISSYGWNPADHYCAVCAFFDNANIENIHRMYATAVNILDLPCVFVSNLLVFILCHDDMLYDNSAAQIRQISDNFNASLIFSMPVPDIRNIYYAYDQAQFVISRGKLEPKTLYLFYDYAVDYLISHCEQKALLSACKKEIVQLVRGRQKDMDMARTLEAYLLQERSLQRTSSVMHLHRNTVSYRIQKLSENSYIDLDSTYDREYIKFSFAVLRYFNFM